jgi:hypothetical protein
VAIRRAQDQGIQDPHLFLQETDRVLPVGRPEGIAADQLGQAIALVSGRALPGAHLVKTHANPALGQLPSRLASGKAAADDRHIVVGHLGEFRRKGEQELRKISVFLCKKLGKKNLLLFSVQL